MDKKGGVGESRARTEVVRHEVEASIAHVKRVEGGERMGLITPGTSSTKFAGVRASLPHALTVTDTASPTNPVQLTSMCPAQRRLTLSDGAETEEKEPTPAGVTCSLSAALSVCGGVQSGCISLLPLGERTSVWTVTLYNKRLFIRALRCP